MASEISLPILQHPHGELPLVQPADPLLPEGYDWREEVLVTPWGGVLPTVKFSQAAFLALELLTQKEIEVEKEKESRAILAAKFLVARAKVAPAELDETLGCWMLPLSAEVDEKNRARYPRASVSKLGWSNAGTHQLAFQELRGITIPSSNGTPAGLKRHPVDHLCHNHACCNPYHLECVEHGENTARGATVRKHKIQPQLFFPPSGNISVESLVKHEGYCLTEESVVQ